MKTPGTGILLLLFFAFTACKNEPKQAEAMVTPSVITSDTMATFRSTVQKSPVASHQQKVPDELNDWKFAVQVYETSHRFRFTVRMQYKELRISDSITLPNLGIEPTVQIQPDKERFSCTLGFPDKKGIFKPYYQAKVHNEQLRFKKIASYAVGVYRTEMKQ